MNGQNLLIVQTIITQLGITESWVINAMQKLVIRPNDKLEEAVTDYVLRIQDNNPLSDIPYIIPNSPHELIGELSVGRVIGTENIRFKIPIDKLQMHLCVAGSAGFGKSTFALSLAEQAHLNRIKSIKIFDPKADDYFKLAIKHPDFIILNWRDIKFNPYIPPPNVSYEEWFQTIVGHMSQCFNFWQGAESLLLQHLYDMKEKSEFINNKNLLNRISNSKQGFGQKDLMSKSTVVSRLKMFELLFQSVLFDSSDLLPALSNKNVIILTRGMMPEAESWFTEFLLLWEFTYRVYNPDKRHLTLHIYDECQHRLFSNKKETSAHLTSSALVSKLVDEARAMNLSICSLSQEPSTLLKSIVNNSWLKVAFRLGSGGEFKIINEAMGLNQEQADSLYYLEIGEAVVRMASGFLDAYPVEIDNFEQNPAMSEQEFTKHQQEQIDILHNQYCKEEPVISSKRGDNDSYSESFKETFESTNSSKQNEPETNKSKVNKPNETKSTENKTTDLVTPLLMIWLNQKNIFLTQGQIFKIAGITSGSQQAKIKKILIRDKLITIDKIQVGKTFSVVWEPSNLAFDKIGIKKPIFPSKGGYLHSFIAYNLQQWGIKNGYTATIEFLLANNKLVDLVLQKENKFKFYEIVVSHPLDKELSNIIKDFGTNLQPEKLFFVVQDSKTKKQLNEIILNDSECEQFIDRIEIVLAGEFIMK